MKLDDVVTAEDNAASQGSDASGAARRQWARVGVGAALLILAVAVAAGVGDDRWISGLAVVLGSAAVVVAVPVLFALLGGAGAFLAEDDIALTLPDPRTGTDADRLLGSGFDRHAGVRDDADPVAAPWASVNVERTTRSLAVDLLRTEAGYDLETARDALHEGTWTDDPRAAAYLGAATLPASVRVRDWLSGEPERRQVEATVAELAAIAGVEYDSDLAVLDGERPDDSRAGEPTPEVTERE